MSDYRIRVSLERTLYDFNDYLIKDVATVREAAEKLLDMQTSAQVENMMLVGTDKYGVFPLTLQTDGSYQQSPSGDLCSVDVLDPRSGDDVIRFELIDDRGEVIRGLGGTIKTCSDAILLPMEVSPSLPSAEEGFRIRAFAERVSTTVNDYLVTGVSTIEDAARKLSREQMKADMSRKGSPSDVDGIVRLEYGAVVPRDIGIPVTDDYKGVQPLELTESEERFGFVQIDKYGEPIRHLTKEIPVRDVNLGAAGEPLDIDWPDEAEFTSIMEEDEE